MSLINTRIQNLRAASNLDKYEYRASRYGALDLFLSQTEDPAGIITPDLKELAIASIGSTLETPVIDFDSGISIGSTRGVTIADSENTSNMHTLTFNTYSWGFTIVPSLYHNNEIKIQRDFEVKFMKYLYAFAAALDVVAEAALLANSSEVCNDNLVYTWDNDTVIASWLQREQILGDIIPIMAANDFYGQMHLVGNTGLESLIRNLSEKGLYNEINKTMQFADKILHFTNNAANGQGVFGTGYAVNGGSVGVLTRLEREALLGTSSKTGHEWGREFLPVVNMEVGTYYYESVGDFNAIAGAASADMTRAHKQHYGFSVDVGFVAPYNSDSTTRPDPILRFEIDEPED